MSIALWLLGFASFGIIFLMALFGWNTWSEDHKNDMSNLAFQGLTGLFSYIFIFTLPWRVGNLVHLLSSHRSSAAGLDLYGRPTNGIWFHIPEKQRLRVVWMLVGNAGFQYATQITRIVWPTYDESQTLAGAISINITFGLSALLGIGSGIYQGVCEGGVRKANPGVFPPTPLEFAIAAWREAREEERAYVKDVLRVSESSASQLLVPDHVTVGASSGPSRETSRERGAKRASLAQGVKRLSLVSHLAAAASSDPHRAALSVSQARCARTASVAQGAKRPSTAFAPPLPPPGACGMGSLQRLRAPPQLSAPKEGDDGEEDEGIGMSEEEEDGDSSGDESRSISDATEAGFSHRSGVGLEHPRLAASTTLNGDSLASSPVVGSAASAVAVAVTTLWLGALAGCTAVH